MLPAPLSGPAYTAQAMALLQHLFTRPSSGATAPQRPIMQPHSLSTPPPSASPADSSPPTSPHHSSKASPTARAAPTSASSSSSSTQPAANLAVGQPGATNATTDTSSHNVSSHPLLKAAHNWQLDELLHLILRSRLADHPALLPIVHVAALAGIKQGLPLAFPLQPPALTAATSQARAPHSQAAGRSLLVKALLVGSRAGGGGATMHCPLAASSSMKALPSCCLFFHEGTALLLPLFQWVCGALLPPFFSMPSLLQ